MSKFFAFRSRQFRAVAVGFTAGALALVALPEIARANVVVQPDLPVDVPTAVNLNAPEQDTTQSEPIFLFNLKSGAANPRLFAPGEEGDMSLAEIPGTPCVIPNPLVPEQLLANGCSEVVRFVNGVNPTTGQPQGQIWVVNDLSATPGAGEPQIPALPAPPAKIAATVTGQEVTLPNGNSAGTVTTAKHIAGPGNLFVVMGIQSDLATFVSTQSDAILVATPALPPAAMMGLGALLLGALGIGFGRRRATQTGTLA